MKKEIITDGAKMLEKMPEHDLDYTARTIVAAVNRAFEDPEIQAEFKRWKKERKKKTASA